MIIIMPALASETPEEDLQAGINAYNIGNLVGAMEFFQSAADAGLAEAQVRLAYIRDYSNDDDEAIKLYRAAADQDYPAGYAGLAEMYMKGEGVERDPTQALEFYAVAAELDHVPSIVTLARILAHGEPGIVPDPSRAGQLLQKAAQLGDGVAIRELIAAYQEGTYGLDADPGRAAYWEVRLEEGRTSDEE